MFNPEDVTVALWHPAKRGGMQCGGNAISKGVMVTHVPTGIVITCDDHRSQHKNRSSALEQLHDVLSRR